MGQDEINLMSDAAHQEWLDLKAEVARMNEVVDRLHKSACGAGAERDALAFTNDRLREALERTLPAFCDSLCLHDDNYGSVKHHDMECAEIRRLLGQDIDEDGRIKDAASR